MSISAKFDSDFINAHTHTECEREIFRMIIKRDGTLKSAKPCPTKKHPESDPMLGYARYVWRHVAFMVSSEPRHHCMPCTDTFDMHDAVDESGRWSSRKAREFTDDLESLVRLITNAIPLSRQHGANRWTKVMWGV